MSFPTSVADEFGTRQAQRRASSIDDDTIAAIVTGAQRALLNVSPLHGPTRPSTPVNAETFRSHPPRSCNTWHLCTRHAAWSMFHAGSPACPSSKIRHRCTMSQKEPPCSAAWGRKVTMTTCLRGVTGPHQAAVAIIRLSGPKAVAIAGAVFRSGTRTSGGSGGSSVDWEPTSHRMYYGTAVGPDGTVLDEVSCLSDLQVTAAACQPYWPVQDSRNASVGGALRGHAH